MTDAAKGNAATGDAARASAGRPTGFAHMLLKVSDIGRSERFYVDVRHAYWAAAPNSPRRQLAEALIKKLEF